MSYIIYNIISKACSYFFSVEYVHIVVVFSVISYTYIDFKKLFNMVPVASKDIKKSRLCLPSAI